MVFVDYGVIDGDEHDDDVLNCVGLKFLLLEIQS